MAESGIDQQFYSELKKELSATKEFAEGSMKVQHEMLKNEVLRLKEAAKANDVNIGTQRLLEAADKREEKKKKSDDKKAAEERANEERNIEILEGLQGFAKLNFKARLLADKAKKLAAGKIKDWGVKKLAQVKEGALKLLDMLKKGLGLAALWALFWFIKQQPWKMISEEVKKNIGIIVDGIMGIGAWIGVAKFQKWLKSTKTFVWLAEKFGKIAQWFKDSWIGKMIDKIKSFFDPKKTKLATKMGERIAKISQWFKDSWIGKLIDKIKLFFSSKGSGGKTLTKLTGWFKSIGDIFSKSKIITKFAGWIKTIGKVLGRVFLPFTVLMSLWEAVTGFMDGFTQTEGNMAQKIIGGIGGALKSLLDFFVFGIADMVQAAIVWLLELFGFDDAAVAVGDFNLVGKIKDSVFAVIDFVVELFQFKDTSLEGIFKSLVDIIMLPLNMAVNFIKNLFGWGDPEEPFKFSEFIVEMYDKAVAWITGIFSLVTEGLASGWTSLSGYIGGVWTDVKTWFLELFSFATGKDTDSSDDGFLMTTIKKVITDIKAWFGKMFDFGSAEGILKSVINVMTFLPNIIKDAIASVTEWLLGLFGFDDAAKAVADANKFSLGDLVMNGLKGIVEWLEKLFDIDIGAIFSNLIPKDSLLGKGMSALGSLFGGKDDGKAMGGPVSAGVPVLVGEHGPELFMPSGSGRILPKMQTENAMGGGGGAPVIVNAPTSNVSNGSTSMTMASSSVNPMNEKYFRN